MNNLHPAQIIEQLNDAIDAYINAIEAVKNGNPALAKTLLADAEALTDPVLLTLENEEA